MTCVIAQVLALRATAFRAHALGPQLVRFDAMPKIPAPIAKFLASNKGALYFHGELEDDEADVNDIQLDPDAADEVLSGEESGFDAKRHIGIGFITDRPLFVDVK